MSLQLIVSAIPAEEVKCIRPLRAAWTDFLPVVRYFWWRYKLCRFQRLFTKSDQPRISVQRMLNGQPTERSPSLPILSATIPFPLLQCQLFQFRRGELSLLILWPCFISRGTPRGT